MEQNGKYNGFAVKNVSMMPTICTRKEFYCINCGENGHNYKNCPGPVVSYGITLVSLNVDNSMRDVVINELSNPGNDVDMSLIMCDQNNNPAGININDINDVELFCRVKNCIRFLLIRRKHTLGFLEFMRGRYNIENVDGIIFLFKQMTPDEIRKIKNWIFDQLWEDVWGNNKNRSSHQSEYAISKEKFNKLKNENNGHLNLDFYIDNVTATWDSPEWGFPKGRRNFKEEDKACAIREFKEETGYGNDEIVILDKIDPIEETFIGTNGITYKHVYYLAISTNDKIPLIDPKNSNQFDEIGDIGYFSYEECMEKIRPYHIDRQKIITHIYIYMINQLIKNLRQNTII